MAEKKDSTNMGFVILISIVATIGGFLFGFAAPTASTPSAQFSRSSSLSGG